MKTKSTIIITSILISAAALSAWAVVSSRTFRTTAQFLGVYQGTDDLNGKPQYEFENLAGHDLVNLALGTDLATVRTNEVLAMEIECDSSHARLVVWDKTADSAIATIATSDSVDVVQQQGNPADAFPNRERFVAMMGINNVGNATYGLAGGYLTIAGRLHLDPDTGCPRAVLVDFDRILDKKLGERGVRDREKDTDRDIRLAGRGHAIGVLKVVSNGTDITVLIPNGVITIRRQLGAL